jgi:16S rRNA (adenine1518-N6/adenine1519-N6)-dimethyltransferase
MFLALRPCAEVSNVPDPPLFRGDSRPRSRCYPASVPRRLGQHFLRAASVERLLGTIDPRPEEVFLEIGPGRGALTLPLAARCRHVTAIEIDARLASALAVRAPANVEVVTGDALTDDLAARLPRGGRIVGNLPYYISSPLLRRILDLHALARDAHVMLQDEVARRLAAAPGSRAYGVLSVLFTLWADLDRVLDFPPGAFEPPPRVDSAVLRIRFRDAPRAPIPDLPAFQAFLHKAFARRRRTLANNLEDSYPNLKHHLRLLDIEGSRRAETLSVVEFGSLFQSLGGD